MHAIDLIRRLHQHRAWVNANLLAASARVSDTQLRAPFAIGQGSIWRSLLHLYAAEYVWLAALEGNDDPLAPGDLPGKLPGNQQGENPIADFDELRQRWSDLDRRWEAYLASLPPASLNELIYKKSTSSGFGQRFATRRSDVLLHVCTHAQYTVAQVLNMLRHSGVEKLPDVMLITLARQETA